MRRAIVKTMLSKINSIFSTYQYGLFLNVHWLLKRQEIFLDTPGILRSVHLKNNS
jgi:hypothetical protein